jgi:hypothetical protein
MEGQRAPTLREDAERLAEVARVAIRAPRVLEVAHDEAELAQEAVLARAVRRDVRLGDLAHRAEVVHRLQHRVRVRVQDVRLEAAVGRLVEEPAVEEGE